jgi:hypothetical protein
LFAAFRGFLAFLRFVSFSRLREGRGPLLYAYIVLTWVWEFEFLGSLFVIASRHHHAVIDDVQQRGASYVSEEMICQFIAHLMTIHGR